MSAKAVRIAWIAAAALLVAALTALVFLVRAGDPGVTNWPITWELRSSDNGVLFQFAQDVFTGRSLDWSFSPQVFVFPEIPISLVAYLLAGGTVQLYYVLVAAINNALLFLGLFALIRYLFPRDTPGLRLARAGVATFPLLLLPLIGTTWLFSYHLAPTYYFGMYLMILIAPTMLLTRRRWVRVVLAVALALTGASNPLAFVFVVPAFVVVLLIRGFSSGWRCVWRPAVWGGGVLVVALLIRLVFFSRLQGGSPLAYIDTTIFSGRVATVFVYFRAQLADPTTATILILGALAAVAGLVIATIVAVRTIRRRNPSARSMTVLYFALVPVAGLAATAALIITDYLYFWPVLVAPLVFILLPVPRAWVRWSLPVVAAALVATVFLTGGVPNLAAASGYFDYRSPETRCLDSKLPPGITVGYSTFSDARRLELTSSRHFRLIQLKSSGVRAYWLTNRDYAQDSVGRFFYINDVGDEPPISTSYIESHFGQPDRQFTCAPGQTVLIYDAPQKLAKIKARYSTLPAP
ncbi:MAG: hypothetical protein QOF79_1752 [Actinomycetota bacterium]|nr:hypothetical protein [Actinomycetota bacterium]